MDLGLTDLRAPVAEHGLSVVRACAPLSSVRVPGTSNTARARRADRAPAWQARAVRARSRAFARWRARPSRSGLTAAQLDRILPDAEDPVQRARF